MIQIHIVFNAHLDPIWLWPWQSGLDEALATARSACDRLDAHDDVYFSQGEAWVFQQIERIDPALFQRIAAHVASGRWELVGGWWIQPDCNFPAQFAMKKQIELGRQYLLDRFGPDHFPKIGFNVDSFGHAAGLPAMMHRAGQSAYVMMRPMENEMDLPARLFRWQGETGGPAVTTFRIASAYTTHQLTLDHIRAALTELPAGINHTMCFCGWGDHGGGPSETQIAFIREHRHAIDGAELVFSTAQRFFDTIAKQHDKLPLVTGELQHHAIGCYTVQRSTKTALRRAEHRLFQADLLAEQPGVVDDAAKQKLRDGWEKVCFHHFHDTIGGTCIPTAYQQINDDLGGAAASADDALHIGLRRMMTPLLGVSGVPGLPGDPMQRIVLFNASDAPFDGPVCFEPWLEYGNWQPEWRLLDEQGAEVPVQFIGSQSMGAWEREILLPLRVEPRQMRVLRIDTGSAEAPAAATSLIAQDDAIGHEQLVLRLGDSPGVTFTDGSHWPLPQLELIDDPSDTWTHVIDRYGENPTATATWQPPVLLDHGPLMASLHQRGTIGRSDLTAEWRVYADQPWVDLILQIAWAEKHKVLKYVWRPAAEIVGHEDGCIGGPFHREPCGRERPIHDFIRLQLTGGGSLGVVCPDAYALDVDPHRLRLTLLRSPLMAHHDPNPGTHPRGVVADQGVHTFRFRFTAGDAADVKTLAQQALMLHRPLIIADLTRGMGHK